MNERSEPAPIHSWLGQPMDDGVARSIDRLARLRGARHVAVMPDVHLASDVCVGVALATQGAIYPSAVGSDIGCGMSALSFDLPADAIADDVAAGRVMAALYRRVPPLKHARASAPDKLEKELAERPLSHARLEKLKSRDAPWQIGTLGRGNHFLELQSDQEGRLWLMVHSGSRGMGGAITAHHLGTVERSKSRGLVAFDSDEPAGRDYLADHDWAIDYARASRRKMAEAVAEILAGLFHARADWTSHIDCHHNHVRPETHAGETFWVHRKGALPAALGELGVIPGSMGTPSFHVVGRGNANALASSSHGAGRALSRADAMRVIGARQLRREMRGVWFDQRRAAELCDEAPSAYKDIFAVMRAQRELTRIERELRPVLCYKG